MHLLRVRSGTVFTLPVPVEAAARVRKGELGGSYLKKFPHMKCAGEMWIGLSEVVSLIMVI